LSNTGNADTAMVDGGRHCRSRQFGDALGHASHRRPHRRARAIAHDLQHGFGTNFDAARREHAERRARPA
jgi:hypothetical protein